MQPTAERESAAHKISIDLNEFRSATVPALPPGTTLGVRVVVFVHLTDTWIMEGGSSGSRGQCGVGARKMSATTHVTYFNSNQIGQLD